MQKVYLLLRSNQQTGPFSLEQLIQFDLKPFDLIWIEGKSAGWYYPQEIHALQPHLPFMRVKPPTQSAFLTSSSIPQQASSKKIFVSLPATTKEPVAESLVSSIPSSTPPIQPKPLQEEAGLKTTYSKGLDEVETDYLNWAYQKKSQKKNLVSVKGLAAACLIIGVAVAAFILVKPSAEKITTAEEQAAFITAQPELPADSTSRDVAITKPVKQASSKKQKQKEAAGNTKTSEVVAKQSPKKENSETAVTVSNETNDDEAAPVVKEENKPVIEEKNAPVTTEAPKEKKKLRDKIADLFKKKPKEEDAKPVEEKEGQRNSTRRESGSNLVQLVAIKFVIPNEWMMGIKGAKATLTNKSSEVIVKAVVEVIYYNDENEILDKKTISFSGIKSKQAQTIPIPDHATATRLEYNVVSATRAGEPFAKL